MEFYCSSSSSLLSTQMPGAPAGLCRVSNPNPSTRGRLQTSGGAETIGTDWGVCTPQTDLRPQAPTGESATLRDLRSQALVRVGIMEGPPCTHPQLGGGLVPEPVDPRDARELDQRLPEEWLGWRRAGLGPLSWLQPKIQAKLAWPV